MHLQPPALARSVLDTSAAERADVDLLPRLRDDPGTRVLVVRGDRGPADSEGLTWMLPGAVPVDAEWGFLGRAPDGTARLVAVLGTDVEVDPSWVSLRTAGGELSDEDAGAFVAAVSLARWFEGFAYCPRCGESAPLQAGGWSRRCTGCGRVHFPRTDPAVIVAVRNRADDRLLLGQNAQWAADNRFSTFAGFVEAGESLETTIRREIAEEAGVVVEGVEYRASQAWPYPRSLMLGFHAVAADEAVARPDGDEIVAVRWFTRAEIASALAGEGPVALPGTSSIARRLIADWCEATP